MMMKDTQNNLKKQLFPLKSTSRDNKIIIHTFRTVKLHTYTHLVRFHFLILSSFLSFFLFSSLFLHLPSTTNNGEGNWVLRYPWSFSFCFRWSNSQGLLSQGFISCFSFQISINIFKFEIAIDFFIYRQSKFILIEIKTIRMLHKSSRY
jgi:hypothetical protein